MTSTPSHTVTTDAGTYAVVDDLTATLQVFVIGRALDEMTGNPPETPLGVEVVLGGLDPSEAEKARGFTSTGGLGTFAVNGETGRAFPNLGVTSYDIDLRVSATGYLPTLLPVHVPSGAVFPLAPVTVPLRRPAVWLKGRVTTTIHDVPVVSAQVSTVVPANLVGLQAPLSFGHAATTSLQGATLTSTGSGLALLQKAYAGESALSLVARTGLASGGIVKLGTGAWREYAVIDHLEGPLDLTRQGRAVLNAALVFDHQAGSLAVPVAPPGPPLSGTQLSLDAFEGDEVLLTLAPGALTDGAPVQIADANPSLVEWRVARLPVATTDASGFYAMGPLARTAQLTLHVVTPGGSTDVTCVLDYGHLENVCDVRA